MCISRLEGQGYPTAVCLDPSSRITRCSSRCALCEQHIAVSQAKAVTEVLLVRLARRDLLAELRSPQIQPICRMPGWRDIRTYRSVRMELDFNKKPTLPTMLRNGRGCPIYLLAVDGFEVPPSSGSRRKSGLSTCLTLDLLT